MVNLEQEARRGAILDRRASERSDKAKSRVRPWRRFRTRIVEECACAVHARVLLLMRQRDDERDGPRREDLNAVIGGFMAATTIVRGLKYKDEAPALGEDAEALAEALYNSRFGDGIKEGFICDWAKTQPRAREIWVSTAEAAIEYLNK